MKTTFQIESWLSLNYWRLNLNACREDDMRLCMPVLGEILGGRIAAGPRG